MALFQDAIRYVQESDAIDAEVAKLGDWSVETVRHIREQNLSSRLRLGIQQKFRESGQSRKVCDAKGSHFMPWLRNGTDFQNGSIEMWWLLLGCTRNRWSWRNRNSPKAEAVIQHLQTQLGAENAKGVQVWSTWTLIGCSLWQLCLVNHCGYLTTHKIPSWWSRFRMPTPICVKRVVSVWRGTGHQRDDPFEYSEGLIELNESFDTPTQISTSVNEDSRHRFGTQQPL